MHNFNANVADAAPAAYAIVIVTSFATHLDVVNDAATVATGASKVGEVDTDASYVVDIPRIPVDDATSMRAIFVEDQDEENQYFNDFDTDQKTKKLKRCTRPCTDVSTYKDHTVIGALGKLTTRNTEIG